MSFDLKETYKHYSNAELLRITLQPEQYRTEAIAAAQSLLAGRTVTAEDHRLAEEEQAILSPDDTAAQQGSYITDLLDPGLKTDSDAKAETWINLLSTVALIRYLWMSYHTIKRTIYFATSGFSFPWWTLISYLDVIAIPVILYLVYRRKRLGWILFFANELFLVVLRFYQLSASGSDFIAYLGDNAPEYLGMLLLNIGSCFILWHPFIAERLYVSKALKKKTFFIILAITLLYLIVARYLLPLVSW